MNPIQSSYGLGWQPDLPDLRDKTFAGAIAKMKLGNGNDLQSSGKRSGRQGPPRKEEGGNPVQAPLDSRRTYKGWQFCAGELEKHLGSIEGGLRERLERTMVRAFGRTHTKRSLLLDEPPEKKLPYVDLSPFMSPVEQQENIGSCTAHAVMGLIEYLQIATRGDYVDGSRLFLYKATRNLLRWTGDTGAYIRETIKAVRLFGICPEIYWSYAPKQFDAEPSPFCYAFAANYKALRYYRLATLSEIKQSISQGYPVAFGFTCFESLFTEQARITGRIPYPSVKEKTVGGHAVLAVGYNDADEGGTKNRPCPPGHVIIRNSWGPEWGQGGYGFLPYKFFETQEEQIGKLARVITPLADDFWTMTQMALPESDQVSAAPFTMGDGNDVQGGNEGGGVQ